MQEESFGVIPVRNREGELEVLLIHSVKGHWAFPKGHAEHQESEIDAAKRELFEETGLTLDELLPFPPVQESYEFEREGTMIPKRVVYFMGTVLGELKLQEEEVQDAKWVLIEEAADLATFPECKELCRQLNQMDLAL